MCVQGELVHVFVYKESTAHVFVSKHYVCKLRLQSTRPKFMYVEEQYVSVSTWLLHYATFKKTHRSRPGTMGILECCIVYHTVYYTVYYTLVHAHDAHKILTWSACGHNPPQIHVSHGTNPF
jgi:hypothetical protein